MLCTNFTVLGQIAAQPCRISHIGARGFLSSVGFYEETFLEGGHRFGYLKKLGVLNVSASVFVMGVAKSLSSHSKVKDDRN